MTKLDRRLMTQTLRQLGAAAGVKVAADPSDRPDFDRFLDVPLRLLACEFRSDAALRAFVICKLEQGHHRAIVQRIASIFEPPIETGDA